MLRLAFVLVLLAAAGCSSEPKTTTAAPLSEKPAGPSKTADKSAAADESAGGHADEGQPPHHHDEAAGPVVPMTAAERENIGLKTVAVVIQPLEDVRRFPGVIKPHPDRVAQVTSRTAGKIVDIHSKLGDRVGKGQDLIEVQSVEVEKLEIDLIQAEGKYRGERAKLELDLAQAENKLRLARAEAERNRALVDKGIGARKDLIAAENQLQAVQNEIGGFVRQLELLDQVSKNEAEGFIRQLALLGLPRDAIDRVRRERSVTLLHIPSPLTGVIVERPVSLGQIVDTSTALFKIQDDSIVIAEGEVFEDVLPLIRVGQRVRLAVAAFPKRVFEGTLTFIHPVIDPAKRTAHVWAQVPNPERELKQDMFAQINVIVAGGRPVITIPAEAVIAAEGEEFVFVEREGGFARVAVATGARNDRFVEVKRGLKAGERVVIDGKRQVYTKLLTARSGGAAMGGHTH